MNHSFHSLLEIFDNAVLTWGLLACGAAQFSKLIVEYFLIGEWRPAVLLETGGMPSSHSAFVTGTAAAIGLDQGFDRPIFALAVTVAFVVMYDASGIRRAAGFTASRVNLLPKEVWRTVSSPEPLKESLGHTRVEVLVGSLIGPLVALPGFVFWGSPIDMYQNLLLLIG